MDPALSVAVAMAAGMAAQALSRHLRVPGIVLLLATGVALGPDLLGIVHPDTLGSTLQMLVGFAVAVILFEGGMNLNIRRLRREARSIQQLVTAGAVVTAAGGAAAARIFLGWEWQRAVLFGTLVIVTGPTVITPLLRRLRVKRSVATVLEAEGVLIDAVGALMAVVTLEVVLHPGGGLSAGAGDLFLRLGFGLALGALGGLLLALLLRIEPLVPEGLENVFTLSMVLVLFQTSNGILPETGIVAVTAAGFVVGNVQTRVLTDLREFKEQLTVLLIGMLFVLLAADVRLEQVQALGRGGLLVVLALMLVVRPLNVAVGTFGSDLGLREKVFLSWMAPRGIVAAAVSSLFAEELEKAGLPGGPELRALVFLVIAATVLIQGLSGGPVAQLLGLRRPTNAGFGIVGANEVGLAMAGLFKQAGHEVVLLDSNPDNCKTAEARGFRVLFGTAFGEGLLARAEIESRAGCLAVTPNDEVNLLFARKARKEYKVAEVWVALRTGHTSVSAAMVEEIGARVLFGEPRNIDLWSVRLEREQATVRVYTRQERGGTHEEEETGKPREPDGVFLPLALRRGGTILPYQRQLDFKKGDELVLVVSDQRREEAEAWLAQQGWSPALPGPADQEEAAPTG